jgi:fatty acid desaturase
MATFPHHYKTSLSRCVIRIDDKMIDVTNFRNTHPGGAELLDLYHNADATDVFYAFHSKRAIRQLKNMRGQDAGDKDPQRDQISVDFEKLRLKLERNGWFERNWLAEACLVMGPCVALCLTGTLLAWSYPVIAAVLIGIGMQQAGWIGHDYGHGRGNACKYLNLAFGCTINGFSPEWWSHKHNTHHAFPNRLNVDADIHNEPVLHMHFPRKENDPWFRKFQHRYYLFAYAFLYLSWRMQSLQFALGKKDKIELTLMAIGYTWLASLPLAVSLGSILIGGWLVAVVVTSNHQPEPKFGPTDKYNFVADQIISTRDVECPDWITEYLFGGMQYQLEHHLFPFLPKYRYRAVRGLVKKFAEDHGLEFKCSGIADIMVRNYNVMKTYAA